MPKDKLTKIQALRKQWYEATNELERAIFERNQAIHNQATNPSGPATRRYHKAQKNWEKAVKQWDKIDKELETLTGTMWEETPKVRYV